MRHPLLALLGIAAAAGVTVGFFTGGAAADPYRWCAIYSGRNGGATNCSFVTLEPCRVTVSGIGGFCTINQFYTGPEAQPARRTRKQHNG